MVHADPVEAARSRVRDRLGAAGFEVHSTGSVAAAQAAVEDLEGVDAVVTEHAFPDGTGLELFRYVREAVPEAICVLYTEVEPASVDADAVGEVVAEYVHRDDPDSLDRLVDLLERSAALRVETSYPLPGDEPDRLAAVERYAADRAALDDALDRLTELATELFGVDSAAIGLVEERHEEFIARQNTPVERIDRGDSICTHAILATDPTVIEDVRADPRFRDEQTLERAGIGFYAGVPLVTPEGYAIGTVCLFDASPRRFSDRERRLLELVGEEAMEVMNLRRRLREAAAGDEDRGLDAEFEDREGAADPGDEGAADGFDDDRGSGGGVATEDGTGGERGSDGGFGEDGFGDDQGAADEFGDDGGSGGGTDDERPPGEDA